MNDTESEEEVESGEDVEEPGTSTGPGLRSRRETKPPRWHADYDMSK